MSTRARDWLRCALPVARQWLAVTLIGAPTVLLATLFVVDTVVRHEYASSGDYAGATAIVLTLGGVAVGLAWRRWWAQAAVLGASATLATVCVLASDGSFWAVASVYPTLLCALLAGRSMDARLDRGRALAPEIRPLATFVLAAAVPLTVASTAILIATLTGPFTSLSDTIIGGIVVALVLAGLVLVARARTAGIIVLAVTAGGVGATMALGSEPDVLIVVLPLAVALAAFAPLIYRFWRGRATPAWASRLPSTSTALAVYTCALTVVATILALLGPWIVDRSEVFRNVGLAQPQFDACFADAPPSGRDAPRYATVELFIAADGRVTNARATNAPVAARACVERVARQLRFSATRGPSHEEVVIGASAPAERWDHPAEGVPEDQLVVWAAEDRFQRCFADEAPSGNRVLRTVSLWVTIAADGRVMTAQTSGARENACVERVARSLRFPARTAERMWAGRIGIWPRESVDRE